MVMHDDDGDACLPVTRDLATYLEAVGFELDLGIGLGLEALQALDCVVVR